MKDSFVIWFNTYGMETWLMFRMSSYCILYSTVYNTVLTVYYTVLYIIQFLLYTIPSLVTMTVNGSQLTCCFGNLYKSRKGMEGVCVRGGGRVSVHNVYCISVFVNGRSVDVQLLLQMYTFVY